jgi:hypothetical protein
MIRLNKNIALHTEVFIPHNLSWQASAAEVGGTYTIQDHYGDDQYILKNVANGSEILVDFDSLSFLCGESVENPPMWTIIDPDKYQPEKNEEYNYNYYTEDREKFGFWYCGWRGKYSTLSASLLTSRWCYGKMPWD